MHVTSSLLAAVPGVVHGFGTQNEPVPSPFQRDWDSLRPLWRQVHGTAITCVEARKQECGEVDGLFTEKIGLPIAVVTADCVPILLANKKGSQIAAVHAGWRGTRSNILVRLFERLKEKGENPKDWVAAIGPAAGPCCYEVSEELAQDFLKEFFYLGEKVAVPRHRILDLPAINAGILTCLGLADVEVIRACPICSMAPRFHSYRREGRGTRQWSVIELRGSD